MMNAEQIREFQREQQEKSSIDEKLLIRIQKEILKAIEEDADITGICLHISRSSVVEKLKSLGFGIENRSGYGRGALYIISW